MRQMLGIVDTALSQVCDVLGKRLENVSPLPTVELEAEINNLRAQLRTANVRAVDVSVTRLRKKLGPLAAAITTRKGFGYGL